MDQADIEGTVEAVYRAARLDPDEPAAPLGLARQLLGNPVRRASGLIAPAVLARVGTEWRIYLRRGLSDRARDWLVAHEIAEWVLAREGYCDSDAEQVADLLGAALRAPRRAFAQVARVVGPSWPALARAFGTSQSSAALRWGEVTGGPLALLAPRKAMRVRGEPFVWPSTSPALELPGLVRERLRDDSRRVVLRVAS